MLVSWDGWTGGYNRDSFCDVPPGSYPNNSAYWIACDQIERASGAGGVPGDADNDWMISGDDMYSIPSGRVGIGVSDFPEFWDGKLEVVAGVPGPTYAVKASCIGARTAIKGESIGGTGVEGTAEAGGGGSATGVSGSVRGGSSSHAVSGFAEGYNAQAFHGEAFGERSTGVTGRGDAHDFYAFGPGVDYGSLSSIRWKTDIRAIHDPLGKVLRLRGVYFDWDKQHGGHHDLGMVAEEVGEVLPEIVTYEENSVYATGMDYSKLTPILVEAVKELKAENESLKMQLEAETESLNQRVEVLEDIVRQHQFIVPKELQQ
ncbi:MAG: tail fiber domain-containing protein [Planctomycetota bacterium]|jgi:hypothetical protein